jgi:ketosteroid isomerase-like protein
VGLDMLASKRLIIEATYAAWADQDLGAVSGCLHRDAVYMLHLPADAWPLTGPVRGRPKILTLLNEILHDFEVLEYRPLKIVTRDDVSMSRAKIHYGHKATGLSYEATVRNVWRIEGDKIRSFEAFHDAARLRAFYAMVRRAGVEV